MLVEAATMTDELDDILTRFAALLNATSTPAPSSAPADSKNFRCEGCVRCTNCRFCVDCTDCDECTYCEGCEHCERCTQSRMLDHCIELSQASSSAHCHESSYLVLCYGCTGCLHCFGCVGLEQAEFHILNQPMSRKAYFEQVSRLKTALDDTIRQGWSPPWRESSDSPELALWSELETLLDEPPWAPPGPPVVIDPDPSDVERPRTSLRSVRRPPRSK